MRLHRVVLEESSVFVEVTVSVIGREKVDMHVCLILSTQEELFESTNTNVLCVAIKKDNSLLTLS